ncbi:hypothetical protein Tph_c27080 [Thermacetogenium phaeum DSM 12270]|uniref:UPF0597 protein Tph_c27080 n=1 Tax=Thermacetogenium phaeum (strain ATCC BAA-254 / DSM 26808 / PB) TaxID=1089553 RepID=K4LJ29_THEPS|nr:L-serine ammonia-lyase, iron-sulfur-dependent, subunit alpha [Thermacetogenium phaeum]AFV12873.1 hypothetical protein Tph_c27080 [Thermacetogenium phaeum DSM 12270]
MAGCGEEVVDFLKRQVRPALGCTDPGVIALAAATARRYLSGTPLKMRLVLSGNLFKNASGARIPRLGEAGIPLAALLGALAGDADAGLEVLKSVTEEDVVRAKELLKRNPVDIEVREICPDLFVEAHLFSEAGEVLVRIEDDYTNVTLVKVDGETLFQRRGDDEDSPLSHCDWERLKEFASSAPLDNFGFLLEGLEMNMSLALLGLEGRYGLGVGKALQSLGEKYRFAQDPLTRTRLLTAAAVDARMGGAELPAMSTGGSGNQGICAFLPIGILAEHFGIDPERKVRGLVFSNLLTLYAKEFIGRLGGACGAAICAGIGVAAAATWMLGGGDREITAAVNNLAGNLSGMVCDGGKPGCAFKVSTSAYEAVLASLLSLNGVEIGRTDGIVGGSIRETMENVAMVCSKGMRETDRCICKIIEGKVIPEKG